MSINVCHVTKNMLFHFFLVISALMFWTLIITTKSQRLSQHEVTWLVHLQNWKQFNRSYLDSIWSSLNVARNDYNTFNVQNTDVVWGFFKVRRILGAFSVWIVISLVLAVRCNVFDCWSLCLLFVVRPRTDSLSACQFSDGHILMRMQLWHHRNQTSLFQTVSFYFLCLFNKLSTQ